MQTTSAKVTVNGRQYRWPEHPVVVLCIDGSEPAYIEQAVAAGAMPWTKQILATRGTDLRCRCVIPSFTNPNNLSIVTGVEPSIHGICGNFYYDRDHDVEVMMNDPALLRVPTIFQAFQHHGAKVVVITAKDKLRRLLGKGLHTGTDGAICFSSEKADQVTLAEHGIENATKAVGMPVPSVYSAELSRFLLAAGIELMKIHRPKVMYLSTTDYIQHKYAPGTEEANAFYSMIDEYCQQLDSLDVVIGITADHGMNAKHDSEGNPNVLYLQDWLDQCLEPGETRVILPITDPYVVHHGALGSFATVYLSNPANQKQVMEKLETLEEVDAVYDNESGCRAFGLAPDRMGDILLTSTTHTVIGTSQNRHDLSGLDAPLRSHGGTSEQTVPLIVNHPITSDPNQSGLRNFDVFDMVLNHTTVG